MKREKVARLTDKSKEGENLHCLAFQNVLRQGEQQFLVPDRKTYLVRVERVAGGLFFDSLSYTQALILG